MPSAESEEIETQSFPKERPWLFAFLIAPDAVISIGLVSGALAFLLRNEGVDPARSASLVALIALPYDVENHLIEAQNGTWGTSTYLYDPLGHRKQKQLTSGSLVTTTQFVLDGNEEIADYSGTGVGAAIMLTVRGVGGLPVAGVTPSSQTATYYHHDVMGSTVAATSAGASESYTYSDYGAPGAGTWATYRYAGYRYDNETGLYYVNARYYNPNLGRFLQTDPIGLSGGTNLYAYVGNDPINFIDPTGLSRQETGNDSGLQQTVNSGTVAKGVGEIAVGVAMTVAAIVTAPEAAGVAATLAVVSAVIVGEGVAGKGMLDTANGFNVIDNQQTVLAKDGMGLATNPASAAVLPFMGPQGATQFGNIVGGVMGVQDLATPATGGLADAISKGASVQSVSDAISTVLGFVNQAISNVKNWISLAPVQ